ncbi:MAG: exodeoxyribonuclease V subunit gamma [Pseudopedobacter saltans]|uniref:RecBCD enzyme subunit RecC n=1 Tax=Pseudopedobacter saltans TaxID=151895 RepID=A0A2W5H3Y3_9SPHI|nr:MAG: exodeoxyribonuclease V subunit gamma [Pseudopedobacter saltans]
MSLHLEVSNSLVKLADTLLLKIAEGRRGVFEPITIVTQTEGINLWLREYIAKKNGIAANINFITPNDIVFKIFQILGGTYSETISRETLIWLLYKALGEDDFAHRFPEQYAYFLKPLSERDRKRMGMATKLADLFDQYQIYRQKVITQWNNATPKLFYAPSDWQEFLWKKIKAETPKDIQDKSLVKEFIDKEIFKKDNQQLLGKTIPDIYLFGLSIFTNYHLDILKTVAPWVNIHFFLLNPAPQIYWMDDKSDKQVAKWRSHKKGEEEMSLIGNPLLTNWGKVLQNTFRLLFRSEDLLNNYNDSHVIVPREDSMLHKIQGNIFNNNVDTNIQLSSDDLTDETLSIHSCYTIASEVDALYQYLVHLVDKKNVSLSARDISVMVSDIDQYEPYIRAVFDNAPYKFKYKIADVSVANGDTIYNALRLLLELNEQEFTSEKILQLLESSYIRKRFNLDNIDNVRSLVKYANIRFGVDGSVTDDTYIVSWQYGIQRLMFGLCMSGEMLMEENGKAFYPIDSIEGNGSKDVISFCHFVEMLISFIKKRNKQLAPTEWIIYVREVIDNLIYQVADNIDEDFYELSEHLVQYNDLSLMDLEPVAFDVFRLHFLTTLDSTKRSSLFINDGITFCSLIPMRSVPFKVIAMLGMTAKDFPRKEKPLSFSLLQQTYQLGDRNIKDNDKHLFLETLISAQEYLYISYIGNSVKDNTSLPSSILVEELIDYVQGLSSDASIDVRKFIVTQHPLHNYSSKYNSNDSKLYRYATEKKEEQDIFSEIAKEIPSSVFENISLSSLVAFFSNAPKAFYNHVLGIYYDEEVTLLPETEIFNLSNLDNAILKNEMLGKDDSQLESFKQKLKLTGKIPLKNVGEVSIEKIEEMVNPVRQYLSEAFPNITERSISIEIELYKGCKIVGDVGGLYNKNLVSVCFSTSIKKRLLRAYIQAMAGNVTGEITEMTFIIVDPKQESEMETKSITLSSVSIEKFLSYLKRLVDIYKKGMQSPYPFSDSVYFEMDFEKVAKLSQDDLEIFLEKKIASINSNLDSYSEKSFHQGIWKGQTAVDAFREAFDVVFSPIREVFPEIFEKKGRY